MGPSFDLGAAWTPTARWQLQASASSGFQPTIQSAGNATYDTSAMLGIGCRITRELTFSLGGGLMREEYQEPVLIADPNAEGGQRKLDKTVDLYSVSARLDFRPEDSFWAAYAEARQNESTSNDPSVEYSVTQVSAGVSAWY